MAVTALLPILVRGPGTAASPHDGGDWAGNSSQRRNDSSPSSYLLNK